MINSDDFYGRDAFIKAYDFLSTTDSTSSKYGMIGYKVINTLTENGAVKRGVCESENGYLTKNGQVRKTAEIIYRYITKDNDFTESHTGLEDVMIEKEILAHCFRQHKAMRKKLYA